MSATPEGQRSKRDIAADMAAKLYKLGLEKGGEALAAGETAVKHAAGLGPQPNVVPVSTPDVQSPPRQVQVGWHPVPGAKWFSDSGIGKLITEKINKYPDPTQHWAVLVGEYAHQLWMDENFHIIYTNAKVNLDEWHMFPVGETRFNDDAVRRTAEHVIATMRAERPLYNLISNNCQTYALQLLDAIKAGGGHRFPTTLAVWDQLVGPGKVEDLFNPNHLPELPPARDDDEVTAAQHIMDAETTQLDSHEQQAKLVGAGGVPGDVTAGGDTPAVPAPSDTPVAVPGATPTPAAEPAQAEAAPPATDGERGGQEGQTEDQNDDADAEGDEQKKKKGAFSRFIEAVRK
ncbi:hypothetical protein Q8F55_006293 [Vanrija albida]|uniref:PPPDE domain-containing protein n=1 Tax=Vanrija albida TaxID=181172 RepID=A0ABR3PWT0_9TREE